MTVLGNLIVGWVPVVAVLGRLVPVIPGLIAVIPRLIAVIPRLIPVIPRLVLCEEYRWACGSQAECEKGEYDGSAHGGGDSLACGSGWGIDAITADPLVPTR
jgi:hypothetical protein